MPLFNLHKHRSTRFIHYDEPNQEPKEHREGKKRIREFLRNYGYILMDNIHDGHLEYRLPKLVTPYIAETEEEKIRQYQIDCLMYNKQLQRVIAVEVHGSYHFATREQIKKTRLKEDTIKLYLTCHNEIQVGKHRYFYKTFKFYAFTEDELFGRHAIDRVYLERILLS